MKTFTFDALAGKQGCEGCPAACCRMLTFPHPRPQTFLDVDYIRYMLGFPSVEILIDSDSEWSVAVLQTCRHLDTKSNRCNVHGTVRKPHICSSYSADQCWYHRNFVSARPPELVRFDGARFEAVLALLQFDDLGRIVQAPVWDKLREIAGCDAPQRVAGRPVPVAVHA